MRHRVATKHFSRHANHRKHLLRNLVREVIEHGSIVTTRAKAKVIRGTVDSLIHKAQTDSLATRRILHRYFGKRDVVNTLVERVAPAMKDRVSGFTTISTVGLRRGDNTEMFKLALVVQPERVGTLRNAKAEVAAKGTKKTSKPAEAKKETKKEAKKPAKKAAAKDAKTAAPKLAPVAKKQTPKSVATKQTVRLKNTTNK